MDDGSKEIYVVYKENYSIESFMAAYDVSRRKFYEEIHSGNLNIYKDGDRTFVTREEATRWLEARVTKAGKKILPHRRNKKPKVKPEVPLYS